MPTAGIFTGDRDFDYRTFTYKITRLAEGLQVDFSRPFRRHVRPLIAIAMISTPGVAVLRWLGTSFWSVALASFFLASAGLLLLLWFFSSVRRTTIWLSPSEIKIRKSAFGYGNVRAFPITQVTGFGIGAAGHSRLSVLKFEVGSEWIILTGANDLEGNDFLRDLETNGWKVPQ